MKQNRKKKILCVVILVISMAMFGKMGWNVSWAATQKEVTTEQLDEDVVLVGGMPIGIYMETDGVLVLNTQKIKGIDGKEYNPAEKQVKAGDYIVGINGVEIHDKKQLTEQVEKLNDQEVELSIYREQKSLNVKMKAVEAAEKKYKLGIWVRDNVQGLGTITFLTKNSEFGALGHGIHDIDTSVLMKIADGRIYRTSIRSVVKGSEGIPGSMEGIIVYNRYNQLGTIKKNTEVGIYGILDDVNTLFEEQYAVQVAKTEEIKKGKATIRCFLDGEVKEYAVEILEIDKTPNEINKGITLKVTDSELLGKTGGIVQGMSGSPILQDGKLVGAVTHVFVNNSTKGYGIFAETMLKEAEKCSM